MLQSLLMMLTTKDCGTNSNCVTYQFQLPRATLISKEASLLVPILQKCLFFSYLNGILLSAIPDCFSM